MPSKAGLVDQARRQEFLVHRCNEVQDRRWNTGRVAIRQSGSFNIQTPHGVIQGISYKYCQLMQRGDGYGYAYAGKIQLQNHLPSFLPQPRLAA